MPVLRALLQERSVTRAAEVVGLTQPAVSNALARLRRRFGDDLLVRVGRGYRLTPLAQGLLDRADTVFDALEHLYGQGFDPATSTRRFTLVLSDYSMVLLAEPLTRILRTEAPGVRLSFQQMTLSVVDDLQETLRQSDGVILPSGYVREHSGTTLITDRWVCVVAQDNRQIGDIVTKADLARLPWVASYDQTVISSSPPVRQLRAMGVEPNVEVSVESFLAVPALLAGSDRIAFIQEKLVRRLPNVDSIRVLPSPLDLEHVVVLHWDGNETNDPGHRWFRTVLSRAAVVAVDRDSRPS